MGQMATTFSSFDEAFGVRPDLHEPFRDFVGLLWHRSGMDPALLDKCRVRVAQLHRCDAALVVDAGSDEPLAIGFAEQFVIDAHGVDQPMRDGLAEQLGMPGLVALTEALAVFDGFTRFRLMLCGNGAPSAPFEPPPAPAEPLEMPDDADPAISASVLAEQPEALVAFLRLYGTLWSHGEVEHSIKEIARLRNARITDCGY
jgi:hypothetical protein